jgi:hypothetical protein
MVPRSDAAVSSGFRAAPRLGGLGPAAHCTPHEGGDPVDDCTSGSAEVASS